VPALALPLALAAVLGEAELLLETVGELGHSTGLVTTKEKPLTV